MASPHSFSHEWLTLADLAKWLQRDSRELEKLAQRGKIPAHRENDSWKFHSQEIHEWLEMGLPELTSQELMHLESIQRSTEVDPQYPITSLLTTETMEIPLEARTRRSVMERLVCLAERTYQIWEPDKFLTAVMEREELLSTACAGGFAFPHPRNPIPDAMGDSVIAYGRTFNGIPFGGPRRELTDLFFLVICKDPRTHLHVLARLANLFKVEDFADQLREAEDPESTWNCIREAESQLPIS